jgi:glycosyltransferase involved in cell wall biosynthesis
VETSSSRTLRFSIIIPVYNRPVEVRELLDSLSQQTDSGFEVLVVEDGSDNRCEEVVEAYAEELDVRYLYKENSGPGPTRNYGAERADGNYYVFFDSDCLIPPRYVERVRAVLTAEYVDAYGGPERVHDSFTPMQKAVDYAMTSFLTTGGIRGGRRQLETFKPRSFNMGIDAEAFEQVGGFSSLRYGEDIDLSLRLQRAGLTTRLLEDAFVYHKRRSDFFDFFGEAFRRGQARILLSQRHPGSLKVVHTLPSLAVLGAIALLIGAASGRLLLLAPFVAGGAVLFADAGYRTQSVSVAGLAVLTSIVQLTGYGLGFLRDLWRLVWGDADKSVTPRDGAAV